MPNLILVRHSLPDIDAAESAHKWRLSEEGRRRCELLADRLAPFCPDLFVASTEPKALETGEIVANSLGKPVSTLQGLHEHDRRGVIFDDLERFEASVAAFFERPEELVFGRETADQAYQRFRRAVEHVIRRNRDRNVAIVAHGTVMTLFVARTTGMEPFPFWKRLGLPSFAVMSSPEFDLVDVITDLVWG